MTDDTGPAPGDWTVSRKSNGVSPGFTIIDQRGRRYFIKFDPPGLPELGTGTEAVVTRLFHALGYYVPQLNIGTLRRENLVIGADATVRLAERRRRRMHHSDIDEQLSRAERNPDGSYRVSCRHRSRGQAARGVQVRRHTLGRSQRRRPSRKPARAARLRRVQRLAEPCGCQGDQLARHADHRERPLDRASQPDRLQRRRSAAPGSVFASAATATNTSSSPGPASRHSRHSGSTRADG